MSNQNQFTEQDRYILCELQKAGYGWRKYAESVSSQKCISDKQQATIRDMLRKLRGQQSAAQYRRSQSDGQYYDRDSDISDGEAMSLGEYF